MATAIQSIQLDSNWNKQDEVGLKHYFQTITSMKIVATDWLALVSAQSQRLHILEKGSLMHTFQISTAKNGPGQEENSEKTPLGLHEISEKIGDGAHPYAVFKSRELTGELAEKDSDTSLIVGRILRLKGLEDGHNLGKNEKGICVDSHDRYIYIHGTNKIAEIGKALSKGCIRLLPEEVVTLFNLVPTKTHVYIYS